MGSSPAVFSIAPKQHVLCGVFEETELKPSEYNHLLIPDFVLLPDRKKGHQTAFAVLEAKYSITGSEDLEAAKAQARSYAVQLRARYSAVMSKEHILIYAENDDFTNEIFDSDWKGLEGDIFSALFKLIGKS